MRNTTTHGGLLPDNQLTIIDYNRVVKDLTDSPISSGPAGEELHGRAHRSEIQVEAAAQLLSSILTDAHSVTAKPGTYDDGDPIGQLDVTITSAHPR